MAPNCPSQCHITELCTPLPTECGVIWKIVTLFVLPCWIFVCVLLLGYLCWCIFVFMPSVVIFMSVFSTVYCWWMLVGVPLLVCVGWCIVVDISLSLYLYWLSLLVCRC